MKLLATALLAGLLFVGAAPVYAHDETIVAPLLEKQFADIPGKTGTLLLVEYPPGGSDPVHRHNAHVFAYVLEGEVIMQVEGEKEEHYSAGETFYEDPHDIHLVGRNASQTKPAKFLAFFVKDTDAPFVIPVP